MRHVSLIVLLAATAGCVNFPEQQTVAKRLPLKKPPVTAEQVTAENAHEMSLRLWKEMSAYTATSAGEKSFD